MYFDAFTILTYLDVYVWLCVFTQVDIDHFRLIWDI